MSAASTILFLCGSAEVGRDGVGDYTRRLAAGLLCRGVKVELIATHDVHGDSIVSERQPEHGTAVPVLRIPAGMSSLDRFAAIRRKVEAFRPDWISLQFVTYSFDERGLPWQFVTHLLRLAPQAKFEVMFHELWLRHRPITDLKGQLTGLLQRTIILRMLRGLRPEVVHTHIPINRAALEQRSVEVLPLPLFANIGRIAGATAEGTAKESGVYRVAFFSRMESPPPVVASLRELADWCATQNKQLEIALLGGGKARVAAAAEQIRKSVPAARVLPVGFLSAEAVSAWLATCDLAISPIPRHSLGKSGTVAAFLEHGLPVISPVVRVDTAPFFRDELNTYVLDRFDAVAAGNARAAMARHPSVSENLQSITTRFMNDLGLVAAPGTVVQDTAEKPH